MIDTKVLTGDKKIVKVKDLQIGCDKKIIISGPCSIESKEQLFEEAKTLKSLGVDILRAGAYKPRTSPYDFQGLGKEGLEILKEASIKYNIPTVTEVISEESLDLVMENTDILQIGTRNMFNYALLKKIGQTDKAVLLKRGFNATIREWIMAAEYIASEGNTNIILCERGIRTFDTYTRNTLDLASAYIAKIETGLPVIADPSHGTGVRSLIRPMSRAAIACGLDGVMIEAHKNPDKALSDKEQTIDYMELEKIIKDVRELSLT